MIEFLADVKRAAINKINAATKVPSTLLQRLFYCTCMCQNKINATIK